ncbi:MAG TPA: glutaminase [Denitromonas sp.]|uniref:glutaminase n=1 Tax=Denitromonas sp. TaxID=2734609 RepID=UPI001DCA2E68|nr:glutaminase [Rhodocyclaceae bacterium]MCP5221218.1 glutaminase [Zoogloeaceae bacterium]HPR06731.1 glutaminase [Denitromonas sp.]HQU89254.1 glutaminase [Denitromonas sp.]HQV15384.1 glutaminase [Denitromonas sp.]
MDYQSELDAIVEEVKPLVGEGKVADYIPALARVPAERFGIALCTVDGEVALAGDALEAFSIQSVSKVFSLTLALKKVGEKLWLRLGREPSGDPFNSLMQLEVEQGTARNPFINAGAICVADQLMSLSDDPKAELLNLVSTLCGEPVAFDPEVAESERATGFRNAALANFMKSFGKIDNDVDRVLDVYFNQCSIAMNCVQMARAFAYLANEGVQPITSRPIVTPRQARRINALMLTCGTYDAAGEFAFLIGLPCKSGVGGGIAAVVPGQLALCVWSPALGSSGNSVAGMRALELFVTKTGLSVF